MYMFNIYIKVIFSVLEINMLHPPSLTKDIALCFLLLVLSVSLQFAPTGVQATLGILIR